MAKPARSNQNNTPNPPGATGISSCIFSTDDCAFLRLFLLGGRGAAAQNIAIKMATNRNGTPYMPTNGGPTGVNHNPPAKIAKKNSRNTGHAPHHPSSTAYAIRTHITINAKNSAIRISTIINPPHSSFLLPLQFRRVIITPAYFLKFRKT